MRNEFADVDTFYLGTGASMGITGASMTASSPARRSRSRGPPTVQMTAGSDDVLRQRRARSKSRPRALYAPDSEVVRVNGKLTTQLRNADKTGNFLCNRLQRG